MWLDVGSGDRFLLAHYGTAQSGRCATSMLPVLICSPPRLAITHGHHEDDKGQDGRCVFRSFGMIHDQRRRTAPAGKAAKDAKAKTAKKAALQGVHSHSSRKPRYSVTFRRPKTLRKRRDPKYPRKSIQHAPRMDEFRTIVSCV